MRRTQIFSFKSPAFIGKSQTGKMYPFSISLKNGSKVEFGSPDYKTFKEVVDGVNALLKFTSSLQRLKYKFQYQ